MKSVWEYKTILVPAMDDWLQHDSALAIQAATGKGHGKIISKHSTFLNEQLGILGRDGWELVRGGVIDAPRHR